MLYAVLIVATIPAGMIAYVAWETKADTAPLWRKILACRFLKYIAVATLALAFMAPLWLVNVVVNAREAHYRSALNAATDKWAGSQSVVGPMLIIPYEYRPENPGEAVNGSGRDKKNRIQGLAVFLPDELDIKSVVDPVVRSEGIYDFPAYRTQLALSGRFGPPDFSRLPHTPAKIDWQGAYLSLGLGSTRAIAGQAKLVWADKEVDLRQGMHYVNFQSPGLHAPLSKLNADRKGYSFSFNVALKGSGDLVFATLGRLTNAVVQSRWRTHDLLGIPPTVLSESKKGFSAEWRIPHLVRNFPQQWTVGEESAYFPELERVKVGVRLFQPNGSYLSIKRSISFGIMPIGLIFLAFVFFELAFGIRIAVSQYAVAGVALCLFYLLVTAGSEHIGFELAYIWSSVLAIVAITLYAALAISSHSLAIVCFMLLTGSYASFFVLLRQPDYGLLYVASMLLGATAAAMYVVRGPMDRPSEVNATVDADRFAVPSVPEPAGEAAAASPRAYETVFESAVSRILGAKRGQAIGEQKDQERPDFRQMTDTLLHRSRTEGQTDDQESDRVAKTIPPQDGDGERRPVPESD